MLLDEIHRIKFIIWFLGSSPYFHLNFGIYEGNLVGMGANSNYVQWGHLSTFSNLGD